MSNSTTPRRWASPVHSAITRPRHKFGVDGRLLLCPIVFPCLLAILFGRDFIHQVAFAALTTILWLGAKVLWEINPYFLDDVISEARSPRVLSEDLSPGSRRNRR